MQNKYIGDIGDYVKFTLLRTLTADGGQLGVAWYLFPDENNNDGGHIEYLYPPEHWKELERFHFQKHPPENWEKLDSPLFHKLKAIVRNERHTRAIEVDEEILGKDTKYYSELLCPSESIAANTLRCFEARAHWRKRWFKYLLGTLDGCNIVFADPDNGLCEDEKFRYGTVKYWKRLPLSEARSLAEGGRTVVVYHHNTRRKGGHEDEIAYWIERLGELTVAVRSSAWVPRTFFVVNPSGKMIETLSELCRQSSKLCLHSRRGTGDRKPPESKVVVQSPNSNGKQTNKKCTKKSTSSASKSGNPSSSSLSETIAKARAFSTWLDTRMNCTSFADNDRNGVALALFQQSLDLADASVLLVGEHTLHGPAYTLVRPLFESYVRGIWILRCASDKEVEKFLKDKCPRFSKLTQAINEFAPDHFAWIHEIEQSNLSVFHSFTHGGGAHIWRRYRPGHVEADYPESELSYLMLFGVEVRIRIGAEFFELTEDVSAYRELERWAEKFDRPPVENAEE